LEHVTENGLWVVGVRHVLTHAENVAALTDVVLDIVIGAFVRQLSKTDLLRCELLIQVVEVETRRWQFLERRREHSCLQSRHGGLELRGDQGEGFVFDTHLRVQLDGFWDQIRVKLVQTLIEESSEVARQLVRLLEARSQPVGQRGDLRNVHVL